MRDEEGPAHEAPFILRSRIWMFPRLVGNWRGCYKACILECSFWLQEDMRLEEAGRSLGGGNGLGEWWCDLDLQMEAQVIPTLPPKKEPTLNYLVLSLKELQLIQIDQIYFSRRSGSEKCRQNQGVFSRHHRAAWWWLDSSRSRVGGSCKRIVTIMYKKLTGNSC